MKKNLILLLSFNFYFQKNNKRMKIFKTIFLFKKIEKWVFGLVFCLGSVSLLGSDLRTLPYQWVDGLAKNDYYYYMTCKERGYCLRMPESQNDRPQLVIQPAKFSSPTRPHGKCHWEQKSNTISATTTIPSTPVLIPISLALSFIKSIYQSNVIETKLQTASLH